MKITLNTNSREQQYWRKRKREDEVWMLIFLLMGILLGLLISASLL